MVAYYSATTQIRQLAAVELRKRIANKELGLWVNVSEDVRRTIKSKIFETILGEQAYVTDTTNMHSYDATNTNDAVPIIRSIVRHSMARVIAAVADIELPLDTWPDLLPFLQQATTSPAVSHREVGIYVIFSILDAVMETSKQEIPTLFNMFQGLLVDPESAEVRITTVRALGTLGQYIENDEKAEIVSWRDI